MSNLTKKEAIAIAIALIVVVIFLGSKFFSNTPATDITDQLNTINSTSTSPSDNSINNNSNQNNMNPNTSAAPSSGLVIKDVQIGTGATAKPGDLVSVNYTGKFADGKVFDSSIPRGEPIQFTLGAGQVIKGWDQGIVGMKVGGKRSLTIPPDLAYGAEGYPGAIPPNSTLYFDVELVATQAQ